jgi:YD repeat-containing protein
MPAGQKIKMYYDPLGRVVRTVNPDASEQRVVFGVPLALDTPTSYSPTPWESYTYDAEDLDVSSDHYATPKSAVADALGRSVKTIDRW